MKNQNKTKDPLIGQPTIEEYLAYLKANLWFYNYLYHKEYYLKNRERILKASKERYLKAKK